MSRELYPGQRRVLYIHAVGAFSGASRSLLELLQGFPAGTVQACILVPHGPAADAFARDGHAILRTRGLTQFNWTRYGYYRGLRWLILLRELWFLPFTLWGLLRARRQWPQIELIHANEISILPTAVMAKLFYRKPLIVHARSVLLTKAAGVRGRLLAWLLRRFADTVVAIDATVCASLPADARAQVVHNGFTASPESSPGGPMAQLQGKLHRGSLRVGFVGNLLALKGIYDFLAAAKLCVERGINADFVIVGSNPRNLSGWTGAAYKALGFAHDTEADLQHFVAGNALHQRVHHIGFTSEVSAMYRNLDVVCFPSHLDAVGRPVLEAAWLGVPAIAAVSEPAPDTFIPGETGLQVPARDPEAIACAIAGLAEHREEVRRLGQAALRLARANFDNCRNALEILAAYEQLRRADR